jgi:hypothetical protein
MQTTRNTAGQTSRSNRGGDAQRARRRHAVARAAVGSAPFDRLEDRQLMAAHVAGSATSYATIQAAVNAAPAGGTVTVDAGSYAETVTVNKSLTIEGAEAGVDARGNVRQQTGTESILTGATTSAGVGAGFYVTANDVTIDGFTVQGETSQNLTTGAGIVIAPDVSGTHVVNDIVQDNVSGLFLANDSATDPAVIQHDVFRNNNNVGTNGGRGIYTDQSISGGLLTNVTIDADEFLNNYGSSGTTGLEAAVALESGSTAASQTDITISNSTFDNDGKAVLAFNVTGLLFTGNVVTHGLDWYSGIVRFEGNDHDVTITDNNLYANTGPAIAVDTKGFPGDDSGFVVNYNNIYGNGTTSGSHFGLCINGDVYDGTFDARFNYWGSASGPSGDGAGTGDGVYGEGHVVSGSSWSVTAGGGSELFGSWATAPVVTQDTAYWGLPAAAGAPVQAEDFDEGGQGVAYNDTTAGNSGGQYRTTGVDIEATTDAGGGYDVGWTAAGEWLDYAVNLTNGGAYSLAFRMAASAAGATFRVLVDGAQVGTDVAVPSTGAGQSWETLSLSNVALTSGPHTVRVMFVANSSGGTGPNFNWFELTNTAVVTVPTAPAALAATAASAGEVDLTWTNTATNATGVQVQRSTDGTHYTTVATLAAGATAYADTGLTPLTTYDYRVVASNAGGNSTPSAVASATTAPAAVTAVSALTPTSATVGWGVLMDNTSIKGNPITLRGTVYASGLGVHASSTVTYNLAGRFGTFTSAVGIDDETAGNGAVDFQVYGDGVLLYDSGIVTGTSAVQNLSVNVAGVQTLTLVALPGVAGSIDYDHADWAGATLLTAAPTPQIPAAPTGLTAAAGSSASVYLSWTNLATNQTGFAIDRSADGGTTWTTVTTVASTVTTYTDTGLSAGTTYTYRVRATNGVGSSAASATATATTLSAATTTTYVSALTPTSATVGWGTLQDNLNIKGNPISLRGTVYTSGLGAHASSTITYALGGSYATFLSDVGIDDDTNGQGAVDFRVYGDGVLLYDSGVLTGNSPVAHLSVSVAGVQTLTLVASPGVSGTIDYDHADWAGARLVASAATTPTTTPTATAAVMRATAAATVASTRAATATVDAQVTAAQATAAARRAAAAVTKKEIAKAKAAAKRAALAAVRAKAKATAAARVAARAEAKVVQLALRSAAGKTPVA